MTGKIEQTVTIIKERDNLEASKRTESIDELNIAVVDTMLSQVTHLSNRILAWKTNMMKIKAKRIKQTKINTLCLKRYNIANYK